MTIDSQSGPATPTLQSERADEHDHPPLRPVRRLALLTQHGKERVLAPVLAPVLGCRVELVGGYDTDQLGTFTRDIPRLGTQIETARKKARIGMELAGLPFGLASEGAFGLDPFAGMFPWNVEILVLIDDENDLELIGMAQGGGGHAHSRTEDWSAAETFARAVGFPAQHLVVRPEGEHDPHIVKGIDTWSGFAAAFRQACAQAPSGQAFLETDQRAHANPTRMEMIQLAAENLAARYQSTCPACGSPGFWAVESIAGLPCQLCGAPTRETRAEVRGCLKCDHREILERTDVTHADPGRCDRCNP